jgi:hypothetical protein
LIHVRHRYRCPLAADCRPPPADLLDADRPAEAAARLGRLCHRLEELSPAVLLRPAADEAFGGTAAAAAVDVFLLLEDPESVVAAVLSALREGGCCLGVGIGGVGLPADPPSAGSLTGSGVRLALAAANEAARKKPGRTLPVLVRGAVPSQYADAAQSVLRLLGRLVTGRSEAEWRVLDQLAPGARGSQGAAAEVLGITSQAVSKAVGRAGWAEERDGRRAAALLLGAARQAVDEWS